MAKPRRYDWSPVDWLDGVATMGPALRGVYDTIINLQYARGDCRGIPDDEAELAVRCHCHWRTLRALLNELIERGKVERADGFIRVKRCSDEIAAAQRRVASAVENANARWSKRSNPEPFLGGSGSVQDAFKNGSGSLEDLFKNGSGSIQDDIDPNKNNGVSDATPFQCGNANHQPPTTNHHPHKESPVSEEDSLPPKVIHLHGKSAPDGAAPSRYAFEGRVIRLNHRDFDSWRKAYNTIEDLAAELTSADAWLDSLPEDDPARKPGKWFHVVSAMLNKKHQANLREQREARDAKPLGYYWDGVSP